MKLVSMNGATEELYNVTDDISEQNQLNDQGVHQILQSASQEWRSQLKDPIFLGLMQNDKYNELHPDRWDVEPY